MNDAPKKFWRVYSTNGVSRIVVATSKFGAKKQGKFIYGTDYAYCKPHLVPARSELEE